MIRRSLVSLLMVSSCLLFAWGGAVALYVMPSRFCGDAVLSQWWCCVGHGLTAVVGVGSLGRIEQ